MTIDDRLTRAGQRFRDTYAEPADVHLAPQTFQRPARAPRPHRRLVGIAVAVCAVVALTVGVVTWVGSSRPDPRPPARSTSPSPSRGADLGGGTWQLAAADAGSGDIALPTAPHFPLTLQFDLTAGRYAVSDGCNDIFGNVVVDGSALRFDQGTTTLVGCADDEALRAAIGVVFEGGSATWAVDGGTLTLTRDGASLTYARVAVALTSGTWVLVAVDTGIPPMLSPVIRYTFTVADGSTGGQEVRIDDDCNFTTFPVALGAATITASGQAMTTAVECNRPDDPAISAAGQVFGGGTVTWSISDDRLTLTGNGATLTFSQA